MQLKWKGYIILTIYITLVALILLVLTLSLGPIKLTGDLSKEKSTLISIIQHVVKLWTKDDPNEPVAPKKILHFGHVQHRPIWIPTSGGNIPPDAVVGGWERFMLPNQTRLFVIRAEYKNIILPGKLVEGHFAAYISDGTKEIAVSNYEILVSKKSTIKEEEYVWLPISEKREVQEWIIGGRDGDGDPIYIGRTPFGEREENKSVSSVFIEVGAFYSKKNQLVTTYRGKSYTSSSHIHILTTNQNANSCAE